MKTFLLSLFLICCASVFIGGPELFSQTDRGMKPITVQTYTGEEINLYEASHALVIGNGNYTHWKPLPGALKDVEQVKTALETHGFNVTLKMDLRKSDFDRALAEFVLEAGGGKANRLLFYYAGHGYTRKSATGEELGYLVMVDAHNPTEDPIGFEVASIDMNFLVTQAEKIQSRHVLFMFDSCFSGTILNVRDEKKPPKSISDSVMHPVRQFITAGRAGEVVPDHSDFKQVFLDLIQGRALDPFPDGYITGEELGYYLKNQVPIYNKTQHPQYGKIRDPRLDKGDFVFVLSKNDGNGGIGLDPVAVLDITSKPSGASVYVDGILVGKTPLRSYQIDTGTRLEKQANVSVKLNGYRSLVRKIALKGGQQFPWDVRLEEMTAQPLPKSELQPQLSNFLQTILNEGKGDNKDLANFNDAIRKGIDPIAQLRWARRFIRIAEKRGMITQPQFQLRLLEYLLTILNKGKRAGVEVSDLEYKLTSEIMRITNPSDQFESATLWIEIIYYRKQQTTQPLPKSEFQPQLSDFLQTILNEGKGNGKQIISLTKLNDAIRKEIDPTRQLILARRFIRFAERFGVVTQPQFQLRLLEYLQTISKDGEGDVIAVSYIKSKLMGITDPSDQFASATLWIEIIYYRKQASEKMKHR
ncbi:caspase family protein [Candidatus Poribacteria bacterium]|nr:caspase family protein [Candidatus Poribacteria bacterium]